ncbi:hypothetical protein WDW86_15290 [Bdellovibrionota bacterium FG-2]
MSDPFFSEFPVDAKLPVGTLILLKKDEKKIATYQVVQPTRVKLHKSYVSTIPPGPWVATILPAHSFDATQRQRSPDRSFRARAHLGADFFMSRTIVSGFGNAIKDSDPFWQIGGLFEYQVNPWFRANAGIGVGSSADITLPTFRLGCTFFVPEWDLTPTVGLGVDYSISDSFKQFGIGLPIGIDYQHSSGVHFSFSFYPIYWAYSSRDPSVSDQKFYALTNIPAFFQIGFFPSIRKVPKPEKSDFFKHF